MIYTTYFAKLKSLPPNVVPIAICGKSPAGYKGLSYKKLAPKYDFFMQWKATGDNDYYVKCFKDQVLDKLNATEVLKDLYSIAGLEELNACDIALVCYEKPLDFCHRHLVSEWFRANDIPCAEFVFIKNKE
jgi:hypothetical protein